MRRLRQAAAVVMFVAWAIQGAARADDSVDIFPPQRWESLLRAAPGEDGAIESAARGAPADKAVSPAVAAALAPQRLFTSIGEWREAGQRIVVLQSADRIYLLCQRCALSSALRPGGELDAGYRLKTLESRRAVLSSPGGQEVSVDLAFSPTSPERIGST